MSTLVTPSTAVCGPKGKQTCMGVPTHATVESGGRTLDCPQIRSQVPKAQPSPSVDLNPRTAPTRPQLGLCC